MGGLDGLDVGPCGYEEAEDCLAGSQALSSVLFLL